MWTMYRPHRFGSYGGNLMVFIGLVIMLPSIFLWPLLFAVRKLVERPSFGRLMVLALAIVNLLSVPLMYLYFLVLALCNRRPYFTSPAAQLIRQLEGMTRETTG